MRQLKITLTGSTIGAKKKNKKTVEALGVRKLHSSVIQKDNPAIRGMIRRVRHLICVEELEEA
jgi:large subunit ribosomal protein L30